MGNDVKLYFSFELRRMFVERIRKCNNVNLVNSVLAKIDDIMVKLGNSEFAFIIRHEIFDFFVRYFDAYPDSEKGLRDLVEFTDRIFSDENFLYQKMMDYVRSYINCSDMKKYQLDQIARFFLERSLSSFDSDLSRYYENYSETLEKYESKVKDKELFQFVLDYIYTHLYLNGFENDFESILEDIDLNSLFKYFEMYGVTKESLRSNLTENNPAMALLVKTLNEILVQKKDKKKVITHNPFRGHIYI